MASIPMTGERFEMGRVMSRTFGTIGRNAVLLGGLIVVCYMLPSVILRMTLMTPRLPVAQGSPFAALTAFTAPAYLAGMLIIIFLYFFMQAAVTYIAVVDLDDRRPQLQPALATAASCALPLFGLGILLTITCYVGLFLLVVPGVILFTMWSVAGVALVAERSGVFASFGRSRALTKGYRWPIFGLLVVVGLLFIAFSLFSTFLTLGALTLPKPGAAIALPGIGALLVQSLSGAVLTLLTTVGFTAIYAELRAVKEGASGASLASIFA